MLKKLKRNLILFLTLTLLAVSAAPTLGAAAENKITGYSTWSVEALTIGYGYIIEPVLVPIYEGENAASMLDRLLTENGFSYNRTGSIESGFYISQLGQGGVFDYGSETCFGAGERLNIPKELDVTLLPPVLAEKVPEPDIGWYDGTFENTLGQFDYDGMSGWMVTLNNEFTPVGFSDFEVSDGDVVRIQFSLHGYGADLGSSTGWGDDKYFDGADKGKLLTEIAKINSLPEYRALLSNEKLLEEYNNALEVGSKLTAVQEEVTSVTDGLIAAVSRAKEEQGSEKPDVPPENENTDKGGENKPENENTNSAEKSESASEKADGKTNTDLPKAGDTEILTAAIIMSLAVFFIIASGKNLKCRTNFK